VPPSRQELIREAETYYANGGYEAVLNQMDETKLLRLFKLHAKGRIKDANSLRKGGAIF
jgi:hypothetical protein